MLIWWKENSSFNRTQYEKAHRDHQAYNAVKLFDVERWRSIFANSGWEHLLRVKGNGESIS